MKESIFNAFKTLGFELERMGEAGYKFEYEGIHYLWMDSDDDNFLNISIPAILDMDDVDELLFYKLMDMLNSSLKYVKAYKLVNHIWLFYEYELHENDNIETLLPSMIIHLEMSVRKIKDIWKETEESENSDDDVPLLLDDVELLDD